MSAWTIGYTREVASGRGVQVGLGANVTRYWIDPALRPSYGRSPWGATVFLRVLAAGRS